MANIEPQGEIPKQRVLFTFPDSLYTRMLRHSEQMGVDTPEFLRLAMSFRRKINSIHPTQGSIDYESLQPEDSEPLKLSGIAMTDLDIGDLLDVEINQNLAVLYEADSLKAEGESARGMERVAITMPLTMLHDMQLMALEMGYENERALMIEAAIDFCYVLEMSTTDS